MLRSVFFTLLVSCSFVPFTLADTTLREIISEMAEEILAVEGIHGIGQGYCDESRKQKCIFVSIHSEQGYREFYKLYPKAEIQGVQIIIDWTHPSAPEPRLSAGN